MFNPATLLRRDLDALPPYTPHLPPDPAQVVKLDSNENRFGTSPRVLEALARPQAWNYYGVANALAEDLGRWLQVPPEQIVVSNGADELIDLLVHTLLEPGDALVDCPPTFEIYAFAARRSHGRVVEVERRDDFSLDVEGILQAQAETRAKVVCLCSPNNPTGNLLAPRDLERLLARDWLVIVDEAYAEFAGQDHTRWLERYPNLALLRTFSKWAGLAGLRVGYGLLPVWLADAVRRLKLPYNVNVAALVAARAALQDPAPMLANVARLTAERERLGESLSQIPGLYPYPSAGNFILTRVPGRDALAVRDALRARGVWVRAYTAPRLRDCLRITVGLPDDNEALLSALREVLQTVPLTAESAEGAEKR